MMIHGVAGYFISMRGEDMATHLHSLCKCLQNMGAAVLLTVETAQLIADYRVTDYEISYIADNIVFLRYLEIHGELHKAIGELKKRLSDFEKTMREFEVTSVGISIGRSLTSLHGILTGTPELEMNETTHFVPP